MKRFVIALALAAMPTVTSAQDAGAQPEHRPMRGGFAAMLLEHREELQLGADQVSRLESLAEEHRARAEAFRGAMQQRHAEGRRPAELSEEERQAMRERMDAMRTEMRAAADAARDVLTTEQQTQLDELIEARRAERHERMRERRGERGRRQPPTAPPVR